MPISPLSGWVANALAHASDMQQAELARQLQKRLKRAYDRSMVNKLVNDSRQLTAAEMLAIEEITGFPAPSHANEQMAYVPLISWVSAGRLADATSQIPLEELPLLAFADLGAGSFFALRVEGDSMDRISPEKSIIVVNRLERDLMHDKFYVFAVRGETTYKRWHAEPPYLAPYSTNPTHEPIFLNRRKDIDVIGRVRRTRLDL